MFKTLLALAGALVVVGVGAAPAQAATAQPSPIGSDVSWPQCDTKLPAGQAFGIVGVNGGNAASFDPCFDTQLAWAESSTGATPQGRAALYVNTANPFGQGSWWPASDADRPTSGTSSPGPSGPLPVATVAYPDGTAVGCTGGFDAACAYVYGYVRAEQAVQYAKERAGSFDPATHRWWLDVETSNTWQSDHAANAASLAGAATYLKSAGLGVGVYSTTAQFTTIVGGTRGAIPLLNGKQSPLVGLPEWGAGASSQKGATANCGATSFTGGAVTLTQWTARGVDSDVSCGGY